MFVFITYAVFARSVAALVEVATCLVLALIMSTLDYCNSMLVGLLQAMVAQWQHVQNVAAQLSFELGTCKHVTGAFFSCTGCRSADGSSSSCAVSYIQSSMTIARATCLLQLSMPPILDNDGLLNAMVTYQVCHCWLVHVEHTASGPAYRHKLCSLQKQLSMHFFSLAFKVC